MKVKDFYMSVMEQELDLNDLGYDHCCLKHQIDAYVVKYGAVDADITNCANFLNNIDK